jgi:hypothetical protein
MAPGANDRGRPDCWHSPRQPIIVEEARENRDRLAFQQTSEHSMGAEQRDTGGQEEKTGQDERVQRRATAAAEFDRQFQRQDGAQVVNSLADGLSALRDLLYTRVHGDVEQRIGLDSMLVSAAALRQPELGRNEIELYQIAESAVTVADMNYLQASGSAYLDWLARLRLGDACQNAAVANRFSYYLARSADNRRRAFAQILERSLPEAGHAPLVIYRLFPLAVSAATSLAFGDHVAAEAARKRQIAILPGIHDCPSCHGRVLANEEKCPQCGNPFWSYEWLTSD